MGEGFAFASWRALLAAKHHWMVEPLPCAIRQHMIRWRALQRSAQQRQGD